MMEGSASLFWLSVSGGTNLKVVCMRVDNYAAKIAAPQQIILQSPSEPEFMRTAEDFVTHETAEQEVYADVRFRAAYSRYAILGFR